MLERKDVDGLAIHIYFKNFRGGDDSALAIVLYK